MNKKLFSLIIILLSFGLKAQNEFITLWKPSNYQYEPAWPSSSNSTQKISFPGIGNNYTIVWEEVGYPAHTATLTNITSTISYLIDFGAPYNPNPNDATYLVKVSNGNGSFKQIQFVSSASPTVSGIVGDNDKLLEVKQWGNIIWNTMEKAFKQCKNLDVTATDSPNLSMVTSMEEMFSYCSNLLGNSSFNNWNTSNVQNLKLTFTFTDKFNQPIGNWNTGNVISMNNTFYFAKGFNQPIGNWNTSQVKSMSRLFSNSNFNQPIGNWDTSKVQSMWNMFSWNPVFNQPIGNWDVSKVSDMQNMFTNATSFNQPIGNWNTESVQDMSSMFSDATSFNQPIGYWNTSMVRYMHFMFRGASSFNQELHWNLYFVKNIEQMFKDATSFNKNIQSWNMPNLQYASNLFTNSAMDCENYSYTLVGWAGNIYSRSGIDLGNLNSLTYSPAAVAARNKLINVLHWTLQGDTLGSCSLSTNENPISSRPFSIYPNPATDFLNIKTDEKIKEFEIIDESGRLIIKNKFENPINIKSLSEGNYILKIITNSGHTTNKFIKK